MTKPPEAPSKPVPKWAERQSTHIRQREKTLIDVRQRDYLKNKGIYIIQKIDFILIIPRENEGI